ncbi:MAG TPA: sugar phosphate nucleotidyltransferase [Saprospiraceae bacterium]|nr:sugar phosphate nucleotidyltransferase [Saprospiraceae bacterium]HND87615.1 sugar phosphate nucleotidyltransferase [Saprospiraceae bacterium]
MTHTYVAIMAGGVGSRFWPGSREARPKQFLDMLGVGKSLLRLTFERFLPICPASHIFVVTNAAYKSLIQEQIPELSDNQILCEPSRNNTAPCVAWTAFKLAALDPEANFVIAPSDAIVLKQEAFLEKIRTALSFSASHDALLTLGVQPSRPDTGYGYIQFAEEADAGVRRVLRFAEKPSLPIAQQYVDSGEYLWNAGIFIWRAEAVLEAYRLHAPDIYAILEKGQGAYNTAEEQAFINVAYPTTPNISVDFAIMEKADNVYTVPAEFGWSDLGTWASLHHELPKDPQGNALQGQVIALDMHDTLVRIPSGKLAVVKGLSDYIIVDTPDVLMIFPKSKEQEVKQVTGLVKEQAGNTYL